MAKTIKCGTLYRDYRIDPASVNKEKRTARVSFVSEEPVKRWFGQEILDVSATSMNMARLNDGAPLLRNHDSDQHIGVVESANIENKRGYATVRFGTSAQAEQAFQDVLAGILTKTSVGYVPRKMKLESKDGEEETYRITDFEPLEISFVAVPADASVGLGRSEKEEHEILVEENPLLKNMKLNRQQILLDPAGGGGGTATLPDVKVIEGDARKAERLRISEIHKLSGMFRAKFPEQTKRIDELATEAINKGDAETTFQSRAFEHCVEAKPILDPNPEIGMSRNELKGYSIVRAIRNLAGKRFDGIEAEASRAVAKQLNREPAGFFIPRDVLMEGRPISEDMLARLSHVMMQRALTTNVFTAAGALVGTDNMTGSFIELLRNNMVVGQMGARVLSGLTGNVAIPSQTGGATAYWLPENGTVTVSAQTVGQLSLTPHRLAGATAYTKQLLAQSSISVEQFVREDLMMILAIEKDRAALNGLGSAGEPAGIINTTGLSTSVSLGASGTTITYANALTAESNIASSNALAGNIGFVTTVACRASTKSVSRFANTDTPVWTPENTINGYKAMATTQEPSTVPFIYGNWNDLVLADWDGVDVVIDPYSLSLQAQIRVVINMMSDCGLRHAKSFLIASQS